MISVKDYFMFMLFNSGLQVNKVQSIYEYNDSENMNIMYDEK